MRHYNNSHVSAIIRQFQRRHYVEQIFAQFLLHDEIPPLKTSNILGQIFGGMPGAQDSNTVVKRCVIKASAPFWYLVIRQKDKKTISRPVVFGYKLHHTGTQYTLPQEKQNKEIFYLPNNFFRPIQFHSGRYNMV